MTLLKEILQLNEQDANKWEPGDAYTYKEIKFKRNNKIQIQGPMSYNASIKEFSKEDFKNIPEFKAGKFLVQSTTKGFENEGYGKNYKVFDSLKPANQYVRDLKSGKFLDLND